MYINKKFILVKFYNNGMNYFFCRIEKRTNFLPKGNWTPFPRRRQGTCLGWIFDMLLRIPWECHEECHEEWQKFSSAFFFWAAAVFELWFRVRRLFDKSNAFAQTKARLIHVSKCCQVSPVKVIAASNPCLMTHAAVCHASSWRCARQLHKHCCMHSFFKSLLYTINKF